MQDTVFIFKMHIPRALRKHQCWPHYDHDLDPLTSKGVGLGRGHDVSQLDPVSIYFQWKTFAINLEWKTCIKSTYIWVLCEWLILYDRPTFSHWKVWVILDRKKNRRVSRFRTFIQAIKNKYARVRQICTCNRYERYRLEMVPDEILNGLLSLNRD